ncbi:MULTISPECIES: Ig-like domain repeat protein [Pseudomonas]|uniref:Uncharacterized protein n=1 Tax=Pseudomonas fulva TaxID=47880 RepID=A0A0D0KHJ1_9PSED|nr:MULTISPECIES: Ig-like domain repeat protein [Pseudomonas]KIP98809.1 hypothetical protein RU08_14515 [Pseudomonas fulva]
MQNLITVVNKSTHEKVSTASHEVALQAPSVVQLATKRSDMQSIERQGGTLVVTLTSGVVLKVQGFFPVQGAPQNDLVIDDGQQLWHAEFADDMQLLGQYTPIDSIEPLLGNESFDLSTVAWVLGGVALAGIAVANNRGDGSSRSQAEEADTTPPAAPSVNLGVNADGSLTVTGLAEAGSTVTVTYPDGTSSQVQADANGAYTVQSPADQPTGDVVATATDAAGNVSSATTAPYVDVIAPTTTAIIVNFADDVGSVQNAELPSGSSTDDTTPTLNGSLSAELVAGERVNVYRDGTLAGQATVTGTTWTFTDASLADATYLYTVRVVDASGNLGEISNSFELTVDTVGPSASTTQVTIDALTGDDIVNAAESGGVVTVTGTITGDYSVGDVVTLIATGGTYTGLAAADGTWSVEVPAGGLGGNGNHVAQVSILAHDSVGNSGTVTASRAYAVDVEVPDSSSTTISFDSVTDDNIVNATEAETTLTLTGNVTGDYQVGDIITLTINDVQYSGSVAAGGVWTVGNVAGSDLAADADRVIDASLVAHDDAGNAGIITAAHGYAVQTEQVITELSIDAIAGDNVINDAEAQAGVIFSGAASGTFTAGDVVTLIVNGTTYTTGVDVSGTWSVEVAGSALGADGAYTATASIVSSDGAGNLGNAQALRAYSIDTAAPSSATTQVTIDAITGDDIVNAVESSGAVTITGSVSGDYSVGDVVTLIATGGTYTGLAAADGTWSVEVAAGALGGNGGQSVQVSVLAHDAAGNSGTVTASRPYLVNLNAPSGTALSIDIVAGDDIVNASEASASNTEVISGTVTGEFSVGDVVTLTIGSFITTTTVAAGGLWSASVAGDVLAAASSIDASLLASNAAGNEVTVTATRGYVVDTEVPSNTSTTISFDAVTDDNIVNATEAETTLTLSGSVTGDYQVGDVITLTINGVQYSGSVGAGGIWAVANVAGSDLAADADRVIDASLVAHDNAGNQGTVTASHHYAVQTDGVTTALSIDAIAGDNIINNAEALAGVTFSGVATGTFSAGDVVTLTINGTAYTTGVDAAGIWSVQVPGSALGTDGAYTASASIVSTDSAGNPGSAQAQRAYSIDTAVPDASSTSLAINTVAGDDQVNLAESSAAVLHAISGTVSGDFTLGDVVTVTIGSQSYTASVVAGTGATGVWQVDVAGDVLASANSVYASLAASDAAGNVGTILAQHNYVVSIELPNAPTLQVIDDVGSVTGDVADNGGVTDDQTPTYQGTGAAGATISLVINGAAAVSVLVDSDGTWSYTAPLAVADGDYTVVATQTDMAGNISMPVSTTFSVFTGNVELPTLVISDDLLPVIGVVADGASTNDATPTFSGTGVAGAIIHLVINGATPVDVTVGASGEWSYTPSESIGTDGSYTVSVTQTTAVGTSGVVSSQFILDTRMPSAEDGYAVAIDSFVDDVDAQVGNFPSGSSTNDTSPLLQGSVAGLVAGDFVAIYEGSILLGAAVVTGDNWIFQLTDVTEGAHEYVAVLTDAAGNLGLQSATFTLIVDTRAPSAEDGYAVAIIDYVDDVEEQTGTFGSGTTTNDTSPVLQGSVFGLVTGDFVRIYDAGVLLGVATVSGNTWSYEVVDASEGGHSYTAVLTDAAGNEGLVSSAFDLTVDTRAPSADDGYAVAIVSYTDDVEEQTGTFGSGTSTNDRSPVLNGTVSGLTSGDMVRIYEGTTLLGTAAVTGGAWTFEVVQASEGPHDYTAVLVDAAGNQGLSSEVFSLIVDTTAPDAASGYAVAIVSYTDDVEAQTGNFGSGTSTNDQSPVLNGTVSALAAGEAVRIYEGTNLLGTAIVSGGSWSFELATVAEGLHTYTAVIVDAAGNRGVVSNPFELTVDITAPSAEQGYAVAITSYVDDQQPQTGEFGSDTFTNDTNPLLQGTVSALGSGEQVRIYQGSTVLGNAVVSGGTWSYSLSDLADGTYNYTARVVDAAGNEGALSDVFTLTVDTSAPSEDDGYAVAISGYNDDVEAQTGSFPSGTSTNDTSPQLFGSVVGMQAGDSVRIYQGTVLLGSATVTADTWVYDLSGLLDGTYSYTAVVTSAAGLEGLTSNPFTLSVDTRAPSAEDGYAVAITTFIDDQQPMVGEFGSGSSTNDTSPLLTGTVAGLVGGDQVRIYEAGILLGTATVSAGNWTYQVSDASEGSHTYTAVLVDAAGNEGVTSSPFTLIVDITAPSAEDGYAVAIDSFADDVEAQVGDFPSGSSTNDTSPQLKGTVAGLLAGEIVRLYEGANLLGSAIVTDGEWAYQLQDVPEGTHTYTAVVVDAAGNEGLRSDPFTLTVDTRAPSLEDGYAVAIIDYVDDVEAQTGTFGSGTSTNDTSPVLQGSVAGLASGDVVRIYEGDTLLGVASVTGNNWSYELASVSEGLHTYTAVLADAAGNEGLVSNAFSLTVDTTAPSAEDGYAVAIVSYTDDVEAQVGSFGSGTSTNDISPVLSGTVTGLAEGDLVRIYEGTQLLGAATVTGGIWTFEVVQASEGSHTYRAVLADAAGNEGVVSNDFMLTVDTRAPSIDDGYDVVITAFTDDVETLVGDFPSGTTTNDNSPLLKGTVTGLQPGDFIRIYQGGTVLGVAVVSDGLWTFQVTDASDGSQSYLARLVDAAGNEGLASNVFELIIDTVAPTQTVTIDSFTDDFGPLTGDLPTGSTTDDATPVLNGTLSAAIEATDSVNIYEGTTLLGTATVTGNTWSFAIPAESIIGGTVHTYTAVIADMAGNEGSPSATFSLTSIIEVNALTTLDTTPIITGRIPYALVDGAQLDVTINGKTYTSVDGSVVVDSLNSTWYVQVPDSDELPVGTHAIVAQIVNGDGSLGASGLQTSELIVAPVPEANFGAAGGDGNNKGTTVTMSTSGTWEFFSNQVVYRSTATDNATIAQYSGTTLTSNTGGAGYGNDNMNMVQNATYIDINRDGHMDIIGIDSRYSNGQQMFINNGDGTYTAVQMADTNSSGDGLANVYSWYGGVIAIDFRGDGYVDVVFGDQTPNDAAAPGGYNSQFVQNNAGVFIKDAVYTYTQANGGLNTGNGQPNQEVSGVDLDNDGTVDVVFHGSLGTNKIGAANATGAATSGNTARLVVVKNDGAGGFITSQIINNALHYAAAPYVANEPSMTWADYDGDGYMDLFMGKVYGANTAAQNNSTIFFNDGAGNLASTNTSGVGTASGTYTFNDTVPGGASLAVDWDGDGRMDIIEAPQIGVGAASVTGTVNLYVNQTSGGTVSFDTYYLQSTSTFASDSASATTFSGAISQAGVVTGNPVTGMISVDVDYDGAKDLLIFTSNGTTTYVRNTNTIADGTSMHVRILDPQGITTYFGNTVKLVNSAGEVVSTQIINPQSGSQTNDSTSIVDFYGLDANETYSIILLRNIGGTASHVGASSDVAGYSVDNVNSTWGGLKAGAADSAYVLTAQGEAQASDTIGAGVVGTGYNDTFFATLGTKRYEGGGGTSNESNYKSWSNTGGMDIVDFKLAGSTALTIDLSQTTAQNTGWNTVTLSDIEGIAGAGGNDTFTDDAGDNLFEGRGGDDTFNLVNGGRDTLLYRVLEGSMADAAGGNGSDTVNGFTIGTWQATPDADRIDLADLLVGYTAGGGARYINGVATIASDETIGQFLSVTSSGGNTTVSIDRDGDGSAYESAVLLTLNGVSTDLATLLANHQLIVA